MGQQQKSGRRSASHPMLPASRRCVSPGYRVEIRARAEPRDEKGGVTSRPSLLATPSDKPAKKDHDAGNTQCCAHKIAGRLDHRGDKYDEHNAIDRALYTHKCSRAMWCGRAGRVHRQSASTSIAGIIPRRRKPPLGAICELLHRSNQHCYSITSSAR
jgi:hypothetical protein